MGNIKGLARQAMSALGINRVARRYTRGIPRIVMYHQFRRKGDANVDAMLIDNFRHQVQFIKRNFVPLTVTDLMKSRTSDGSYPNNAVALTIDDGYKDFAELAVPVLVEAGVPATVFVVAGLVEDNDWLWTDKFKSVLDSIRIAGGKIDEQAMSSLSLHLKRLPVTERDDRLFAFAQSHGVRIPAEPPQAYRLMSWDHLRDVRKTNLVEIGSHTCTHPILSQLDERDSWYEIEGSKSILGERLKTEITSFCYPNGQFGDYRPDHQQMLRRAGYLCGLAGHFGYVTESSDPYALARLNYTGDELNLFAKYLDGVEYLQRKQLYDRSTAIGHS